MLSQPELVIAESKLVSSIKSDRTYLEIWSVETNLKLFLKLRKNFN